MAGYFVVLGMVGVLFFLSGRTDIPEEIQVPGIKRPFYKAAYYLSGKLGQRQILKNRSESRRKETEKMADALMILFLGLGVTLLVESTMAGAKILTAEQGLIRPQNGEGDQILELQAELEGMTEAQDMEILVSERQYTFQEKQKFLEAAMEQLDQEILGENRSPDEVRGGIYLPSELLDGKVSVQWVKELSGEMDADEVIDAEGQISEDIPQEGVILQLTGLLTCQDQEAVFERALHLFPPIRTSQEQLLFQLQKKVEEVNESTLEEETLILPKEVEGSKVVWKEKETSLVGICLAVTLLAATAAYFGKEQEYQKEQIQRKQQMILDYPGLIFQLSMLLEAGLTMQNAFSKIALEYRDRQKKERRFAYEEMLVSYYEMQSGVSEMQAYENFGRRCGENCYIRLGTTLSGNLQKGAQGLTKILRDEAVNAMDERRQLARKLGEEAGTKLLLPMMLMLLVVLVILMVPAVMAF